MNLRVFGVDPGQKKSGWCYLTTSGVLDFGHDWNRVVIEKLLYSKPEILGYEWVKSYGLVVGEDIFRTAYMCGRLRQGHSGKFHEPTRPDIVKYFTGRTTHKKPVVREVLKKRFEGNNHLIKGITNHAWDALAICIYIGESIYGIDQAYWSSDRLRNPF